MGEHLKQMTEELAQLREELRLAKLEARKWRLSHDNQVKLKRALTERTDLKDRAMTITRLEMTVEQGIIPGYTFVVSNDGGKTGFNWCDSLKAVMGYFEPMEPRLPGYSVVAVRKPQ